MTAPFISPAPWTVNASGGARTIVARDRSVVAVVMGGDSAAPFDDGNAALIARSPDLREALEDLYGAVQNPDLYIEGVSTVTRPLRMAIAKARAALAKSEQDGGSPEDGPVETGTGV